MNTRTPWRTVSILAAFLAVAFAGCVSDAEGNGGDAGRSASSQGPLPDPHAFLIASLDNLNATGRVALDVVHVADGVTAKFSFASDKTRQTFVLMAKELPDTHLLPFDGNTERLVVYGAPGVVVMTHGGNVSAISADPASSASSSALLPADGFRLGANPVGVPASPFGNPVGDVLAELRDVDSTSIRSVEATTHKGKPAFRLAIEHEGNEGTVTATVVVYAQSQLPARFEAEISPPHGGSSTHVRSELYYEEEAGPFLSAGAVATRSATLATTRTVDADEITYTFTSELAAVVALPDLEIRIEPMGTSRFAAPASPMAATVAHDDGTCAPEDESMREDPDPTEPSAEDGREGDCPEDDGAAPTRPPPDPQRRAYFSMNASDPAKIERGIRVHYEDMDADGFVSTGDRIVVNLSAAGLEPTDVQLVLRDDVTGAYVTPGARAMFLVTGVLAAALVLPRIQRGGRAEDRFR